MKTKIKPCKEVKVKYLNCEFDENEQYEDHEGTVWGTNLIIYVGKDKDVLIPYYVGKKQLKAILENWSRLVK